MLVTGKAGPGGLDELPFRPAGAFGPGVSRVARMVVREVIGRDRDPGRARLVPGQEGGEAYLRISPNPSAGAVCFTFGGLVGELDKLSLSGEGGTHIGVAEVKATVTNEGLIPTALDVAKRVKIVMAGTTIRLSSASGPTSELDCAR